MALFNYTAKEITLKVVYYGPAFSGKTTNLQYLHTILPSSAKGKLISMATEGDRTIFFDFLPVEIGRISEFNIRFQLYTVPGQVRYNATRRLVLRGADAVIFVADSQSSMRDQNVESLVNMRENLEANSIPIDIPKVFQYNKRDIRNIMSVEELNKDLNNENAPFFEAVAVEGKGVDDTFKRVAKDVLEYIKNKHDVDIDVPEDSILSAGATVSAPSDTELEEHIAVRETGRVVHEVQKPVVQEVRRPGILEEPVAPIAPRTGRVDVSLPPVIPDLSELISVISNLKEAITEISRTLKGIQINQAKSTEALTEFKEIFSEAKEKKKFWNFFK